MLDWDPDGQHASPRRRLSSSSFSVVVVHAAELFWVATMVVDAVSSRGSFLYLFKILPKDLFDFLFLPLKKYERYGVKTKHTHALYKTLFESIEEHPPLQ
jgi:hypothetical protein